MGVALDNFQKLNKSGDIFCKKKVVSLLTLRIMGGSWCFLTYEHRRERSRQHKRNNHLEEGQVVENEKLWQAEMKCCCKEP